MNTDTPHFRFSIVHLLYATALLAAAIAMFEVYTVIWLAGVFIFWLIVYAVRNTQASRLAMFLLVFFVLLILACMGLPAVSTVREASRRTACMNNVRQLALALWNYESAFAKLPPAFQADTNGKPMHSWRVLILPFIEEQKLHSSYDFAESWDGPKNKLLVSQLSDWPYQCPSQNDWDFKTRYKLITGPGTVFESDQGLALSKLQSTADTIAIIEDVSDPVIWMEPRDLTVAEAVKLFDGKQTQIPHTVYETKFSRRISYHRSVAMFDGSVQAVGCLKDPQQIIPYLMKQHPEKKEFDDLEFYFPEPEFAVLYSGYFLLAFNVFLAVLPCYWKQLNPFLGTEESIETVNETSK